MKDSSPYLCRQFDRRPQPHLTDPTMLKTSIDLICIQGQRAFDFTKVVLSLGIALCLLVPSVEAEPNPSWHRVLEGFVDGLVTTGLDQDAVAGAVVVIVSGNDVILSKGYRLADARTGRLMTPEDDIVPLASVTKVFTALAVLQLARDGRLALDDPIAKHLPDLKLHQPFGDIRIIHLLSHTAGLEDRYRGYFADHGNGADASRLDHISAVLPAQVRPPEDVISYSNASYVLLGEIVARVSGQPFETYLAEAILAPMGVDDPHFMHDQRSSGSISPFHVWQVGRHKAIEPEPFPAIHTPSGGLALTGRDMVRVMQLLLRTGSAHTGAAPTASLVADMKRSAWPGRPAFAGRTLGYWTEIWAGQQVYHHGGTHFGFHTNMTLVPALDIGIFVAANGPSGSSLMALPRRLLREIVAPHARPVASRVVCDAVCLRVHEGRYITTRRNETGLDRILVPYQTAFTVRAMENNALMVSGLGHSRRFEAIGKDVFESPEGDTRLGFRRNEVGHIVGAYLNGGIHSFDTLDFWHTATSLESASWAAVIGSLLCLAGAVSSWRTRRCILSLPLCQAVLWISIILGFMEILDQITHGDELSRLASPSAGLWAMTILYGIGVASVLLITFWLLFTPSKKRIVKTERLAVLSALPFFVWSLFAAWKWNLPTASLTW
ncbi:serine hydrolase domain-containing protein [Roseibium album]|uniref:FmtA-like protein n=1 Tax=Roseibium album TaxID=311410 RepID=A0A0M7AL45_9HYPH|nr:serine hydrolase domain-containing protein [Roseibium album]CTQ60264.1 FmtA-like protein [Roseibium album]CTQ66717.1 FmtA-like protein [Roseibium album]CTQ74503.1 FmtA-like protein [Roseibium album]